ncbi:MAG: amino acid ABC transporter substrate-binding protein [Beijerinckiaceae bacterium]|nr:amino acid ABC transporter substrate-binding protein [Beijerinckiaceae bacterium]
MKRLFTSMAAALAAISMGAFAASAQTPSPPGSRTLEQIKTRGTLVCGSNPGLAGFGMPDDKGVWTGLDVDLCRAIAAAIFNDPTKVRFVPLTAKDRFTALQSGEIDVLSRNGTWTQSREAELGLLWAGVNYYDGQAFMVRKKLNVSSVLELSGASICVQQGTTTETNLADFFRSNNMKYEPAVYATSAEAVKQYDAGRCDAYTTDMSGLYSERQRLVNPDEHVILPQVISKEPLGPAVRQGDDQWFNLVKWTHFAMLNAEELGVGRANVDERLKSPNPEVRRLLGVEGDFGKSMGLTADWAYRVIKHVGNYGESYTRNIGEGSRLKIPRGLNNLWNKGGLQYGPPIR